MSTRKRCSEMENLIGKWSISHDEESFFGVFSSAEEAITEGRKHGERKFWIGQCVSPTPPENLFCENCIESWINNVVLEHNDYLGEWAEGALETTRKQREELANLIQPVIAAWLDRHNLRPTHFNIDPVSVQKIV